METRNIPNKKGGLTFSTVIGVGGLIIVTIIMLIVVSTINGADLLGSQTVTSNTVVNETNGYINETGYYLGGVFNASRSNFAITAAYNVSGTLLIPSGNYTVDSTSGLVTNATSDWSWSIQPINFTYTYDYTGSDTIYADVVDNMTGNFTSGIDNISSKIPTILLLLIVIALFAVLALLIRNTNILGSLGGSGSL